MHASPRPSSGFPLVVPLIPQLRESGIQIGSEHHIQLEVLGGRSGRIRLPEGDSLVLQARLSTTQAEAKVRVWTNLGSDFPAPGFHWHDMQRDGRQHFRLILPAFRPGSFYFTLQYTLDGEQWFWHRCEFWQVRVFPKQLKALRMYTLIPTINGPMETWGKVLKEVSDLAFNMIHILPLTRQGSSQSPYAAAELFQLEPDLLKGSADDSMAPFENLVKEAQELDIGLCLDLVLNHVSFDSDLAQRCPHWIQVDALETDAMRRAGFQSHDGFHKWNDLVLIRYNHPDLGTRQAIWDYMKNYAFFWASYAAATHGMIRLDNLHSTDHGFAVYLTRELRQNFPQLGILGEMFCTHEETQGHLESLEIDLLLATTWEHHFSQELRLYFRYLHESKPMIPWFTPVNSHDSGVPAEEFTDVHATLPRYILASLLGTGTTGLTQGVEQGILQKVQFIGRHPTIRYAVDSIDFRGFIQKTHGLLASYPVFQQQGNLSFIDHNHPAIIAGLRRSGENAALIIANLDIHQSQNLDIDLPSIGLGQSPLYDVFLEQPIVLSGSILRSELKPCGFRVILVGEN